LQYGRKALDLIKTYYCRKGCVQGGGAMLEAIDLVKSFGRLRAVDGFSMNIEPGGC